MKNCTKCRATKTEDFTGMNKQCIKCLDKNIKQIILKKKYSVIFAYVRSNSVEYLNIYKLQNISVVRRKFWRRKKTKNKNGYLKDDETRIEALQKIWKTVRLFNFRRHYNPYFIEGSLEVKLPTIWTDEKQRWEESEKRRRKKIIKKRKSEKKEDPGAQKGRKVAKHGVFSMICGSGGSKRWLAKAAGAEPAGQTRDEKLHAVAARSTFPSQKR